MRPVRRAAFLRPRLLGEQWRGLTGDEVRPAVDAEPGTTRTVAHDDVGVSVSGDVPDRDVDRASIAQN